MGPGSCTAGKHERKACRHGRAEGACPCCVSCSSNSVWGSPPQGAASPLPQCCCAVLCCAASAGASPCPGRNGKPRLGQRTWRCLSFRVTCAGRHLASASRVCGWKTRDRQASACREPPQCPGRPAGPSALPAMNPHPLLFLRHRLHNCNVRDWMHRVYAEMERFLLERVLLLCCVVAPHLPSPPPPPRPPSLGVLVAAGRCESGYSRTVSRVPLEQMMRFLGFMVFLPVFSLGSCPTVPVTAGGAVR